MLAMCERIGEVGESGNASGCHLHFEEWTGPDIRLDAGSAKFFSVALIIVGSVLILIRASLIALARSLVVIRPRLILITHRLVAITRLMVAIALGAPPLAA